MKKVALLHNPAAGDEAHSKEKLIHQLEEEGYKCRYSSTKEKGWDSIKEDTDLIVLAGGDGTVRKVLLKLFSTENPTEIPFALLPLGTANNIAKTFGIEGKTIDVIQSWNTAPIKKVDLGKISGAGVSGLFLESFGAGLFPQLMKEMKRGDYDEATPQDQLIKALELLHAQVLSATPNDFHLTMDGEDCSGKFLLVEIMNMRSIGPNLFLAPHADPGDGKLEVVTIAENERTLLAEHIRAMMTGAAREFPFPSRKADLVEMSWNGKNAHTDDKLVKPEANENIRVKLLPGIVNWLNPSGI